MRHQLTLQDIFAIEGIPATMALMAWKGKDWGFDASVVKLLRTAGGMLLPRLPVT